MESVSVRNAVARAEEARDPDDSPLVEWLTASFVVVGWAAVVVVQLFVH